MVTLPPQNSEDYRAASPGPVRAASMVHRSDGADRPVDLFFASLVFSAECAASPRLPPPFLRASRRRQVIVATPIQFIQLALLLKNGRQRRP